MRASATRLLMIVALSLAGCTGGSTRCLERSDGTQNCVDIDYEYDSASNQVTITHTSDDPLSKVTAYQEKIDAQGRTVIISEHDVWEGQPFAVHPDATFIRVAAVDYDTGQAVTFGRSL